MNKQRSRNTKYGQKNAPRTSPGIKSVIYGACSLAALVVLVTAAIANIPSPPVQAASGGQNQQHYWNRSQWTFSHPQDVLTDNRSFYINDSITLPNGLQIQVTRIQRKWQPTVATLKTYDNLQIGDNPAGLEVVLIWFNAINTGKSPVAYSDSMFTLQTVGKPEQRVAHLAELLPTDYGNRGKQPWLLPRETTNTFVPFLISPGAQLESFQYYYAPLPKVIPQQPPSQQPRFSVPTPKRLSIFLQTPPNRTPASFVFNAAKSMMAGQ